MLLRAEDHSDVVREAQEIVELALKAALRHVGIEPPKWHDVGEPLSAHAARFPRVSAEEMARIVAISAKLGQERSLAFYGDETGGTDFSDLYDETDAREAIESAEWVVAIVERIVASAPADSEI